MTDRKFSHVIVIGLDGAGAFIKEAKTPIFDKIFKNGTVTYSALSSRPTISAECWGSMLLGVGPEVHKLTNTVVRSTPYPTDSPFPSLFARIRAAYPDSELGSFCDWNPITYGIVEADRCVTTATARDDQLAPLVSEYIKEKKPDFLFVHFDSIDGAGHRNGYGTPAHIKRIEEVDTLVGTVYDATVDAGIIDSTLFVVISDHGGANDEEGKGSHGGWTDGEKYVTFAAVGKGICKGCVGEMNIRDLAAIVLYALGIDIPTLDESGWTSQIPAGIFEDLPSPIYVDLSHLTGAEPRISKTPHTSELIQ